MAAEYLWCGSFCRYRQKKCALPRILSYRRIRRHTVRPLKAAMEAREFIRVRFTLPFDKEFLAGTGLDSLLVRTARYAIILFLIMGVYPAIFPLFEKKEK